MKFLFIIIFVIIMSSVIYSNEINNYEFYLIKKIENGQEDGTLKLGKFPNGPTCFYWKSPYYYICDVWNNRFAVFDKDFNFIKNIKSSLKEWEFAAIYKIKIGLNFIYSITTKGILYKQDFNGDCVFEIEIGNNYFYIMDDYIIYYQNSKLIIIDPQNKILNEKQASELLIQQANRVRNDLTLKQEIQNKIQDFIVNNELLYTNVFLLNEEFIWHKSFFNIINENETSYDKNILYLLGFDNNYNSYWYCEGGRSGDIQYVTVLTKYGAKLTSFYIDTYFRTQITENGDVIIMQIVDDGTAFYRIRNIWDPIDLTKIIIKQFTQTSWLTYDKDWYMYHTIKAFDGKPATGWIDGSKGSGIGDYIGFMAEKEITIDEIKIMPGYFDKRWWKDNNRIKKLEIVMDNERITASFQDKMEKQSIKLNEEIRFKNIKFIIKDVYKAAKDDDTAIAEIEFYHKGEKLTLDYKKLEYYLLELSEEQALRVEEEEIPQQVAAIKEFSYKNYLIEYSIDFHPVAAFDDIVNTAWIENSKGHGIDDYLGVEFENEIIVDKIIIYPGYFSGNDFKRSNRVKKILIELNGNKLEKTFVDEAMGQDIVFENPVTFKKIKLTIKDVYKSGVYDQTAISEVRFYYNGKKIKIDTSKYAEYLK